MEKGRPGVMRPNFAQKYNSFTVSSIRWIAGRLQPKWVDYKTIEGHYDIGIVGYGGETVNFLRLWDSKSYAQFDLDISTMVVTSKLFVKRRWVRLSLKCSIRMILPKTGEPASYSNTSSSLVRLRISSAAFMLTTANGQILPITMLCSPMIRTCDRHT